MKFRTLCLTISVLIFTTIIVPVSMGFDIACYADARSNINWISKSDTGAVDPIYHSWACKRSEMLEHISSTEQQVYYLYQQMGVTHLEVYWPFPDDFDFCRNTQMGNLKIMNINYPAKTTRYVRSQARELPVGNVNHFWIGPAAWGSGTHQMQLLGDWVIACGQMDESDTLPHTMWKPQTPIGNMYGWDNSDGQQTNDVYMPWHFRIICNIDEADFGSDQDTVALIYWMVGKKEPNLWYRYAPIVLRRVDFSSPGNNFQTFNIPRISQNVDFDLFDQNFDSIGHLSNYNFTFDGMYDLPTDSIGTISDNVRLQVQYMGRYNFYLKDVNIYDEGAWRLYGSNDDLLYQATADTIASIYRSELDASGGKQAGWYYDEWNGVGTSIRSVVAVNKILKNNGLPTFFLNGHPWHHQELKPGQDTCNFFPQVRNQLFCEEDLQNTRMSCQMNEYYFCHGDPNPVPFDGNNAGIAPTMCFYTLPESDAPYIQATLSDSICYPWSQDSGRIITLHKVIGRQSLQCAIDGQFDLNPSARMLELAGNGFQWAVRAGTWDQGENLLHETQYVHNHGEKMWALVLGGVAGAPYWNGGSDSVRSAWWHRDPTPNEVKLHAWMAVACDVDGLMWYPWNFGGLLEYEQDEINRSGYALCGMSGEVVTTPRFTAAAQVDSKITRIAPVLEPLRFVKTYASCAFGSTYPSGAYPVISFDTLRGNIIWPCDNSQSYLYVTHVGAYSPLATGWSPTEDVNSYVQVSHFQDRGVAADSEDYWFLVVNRRALPDERRKVRLDLDIDPANENGIYRFDCLLSQRSEVATERQACAGRTISRYFEVVLEPGEAELVHFYRADTTDLIIRENTTITAPAYFHRNIILRGGTLTIQPNISALHHTITVGNVTREVYDSVATVTFWPGKGISMDSTNYAHPAFLHIEGNDSIRIRLQSANADKPWTGIWARENRATPADSNHMIYTDIINAKWGLGLKAGSTNNVTGYGPCTILDHCRFIGDSIGLNLSTRATATLSYCEFSGDSTGIVCTSNSQLTASNTRINNNRHRGANIIGSNASFDNCDFHGNSWNTRGDSTAPWQYGALALTSSTATLRCCRIQDNYQSGITAEFSAIHMAEPGHVVDPPSSGANFIEHNGKDSLQVVTLASTLIMQGGSNMINADTSKRPWISGSPVMSCGQPVIQNWQGNCWGGLLDLANIQSRISFRHYRDTLVTVSNPLTSADSCHWTNIGIAAIEAESLLVVGINELEASQYSQAKAKFQSVIETDSGKTLTPSAVKEIIKTDLLANTSAASVTYFGTLANNTACSDLRQSIHIGRAWSLAYSGNVSSAQSLLTSLADTARSDTAKVEAQIALINMNLEKKAQDTSQTITPEDVLAAMDSVDYLIASLNRWSDYNVTDSVVMYAPCRVDSEIYIHNGGTLVIKPQPGVHPARVEFGPNASIFVDGWSVGNPTPPPRGRLIVEGEADNPVILNWEYRDVACSPNIFSSCGNVELKNAVMEGSGFCFYSVDPYSPAAGPRRPTFRADSCTFKMFDTGLVFEDTDSSSYLHNCLVEGLNPGDDLFMDYGPSLFICLGAYLDVANCDIRNAGGVGVLSAVVSAADFSNTTITGGMDCGILNWESSDLSFECCEISDNGGNLAELNVEDGNVSLVGGHNIIADSSGTLIYATNPSMVDLSDGENQLEFYGTAGSAGTYLNSGTTSATWDVALNNWSPVTPRDSTFYSHLYPTNPAKWLVDTSLVSFAACGESSTSSFNPNSLIILGQRNQERSSSGLDEYDQGSQTTDKSQMQATKTVSGATTKKATDTPVKQTKNAEARKAENHAEVMREYHSALTDWRAVKETAKFGRKADAAQAAMGFINQHSSSDLMPAAMVKLVSLAEPNDSKHTVSAFLAAQANKFGHGDQRELAKRLSSVALAKEGQPAEALAQLETMMETAATPRDSVKALMEAMSICSAVSGSTTIQPRNQFVKCANPAQYAKRFAKLAKLAQNPSLLEKERPAAVPASYCLYQNFPNPFNPNTEIHFDLPEAVRVELKVFNVLGQEVAKLVDQVKPAGAYRIIWDSKGASGNPVASGMYIYQIKAGKFTDAKKMMLIR